MQWLTDSWYQTNHPLRWLLMPLSALYRVIIASRKILYRWGCLHSEKLSVPVIVVGNITVGGTGKTPFVIWLTQILQHAGYRPGIISRGYGADNNQFPRQVTRHSDPSDVGDEPVMLSRRCDCPVVVDPQRTRGAHFLIDQFDCNVIVTDDGLQHYALQRDIEIAIVDGKRQYGNGSCLPAGPLREPLSRLQQVDYIVTNGETIQRNVYTMELHQQAAVNLHDPEVRKPLIWFKQDKVHLVAGIGHPQRFFTQVESQGIQAQCHSFADHYAYQAADLQFADKRPILMTEKDAVKCQAFATADMWYIPVSARIDDRLAESLLNQLRRLTDG